MSDPTSWLKALYSHQGPLFMLVLPGAIVLCDPPAEGSNESIVHLFMSAGEAEAYRTITGNHEARIMKTTLVGLFDMIKRIDSLSKKQFKVPVRIVVTTLDSYGEPRVIDTLHSTYELLS